MGVSFVGNSSVGSTDNVIPRADAAGKLKYPRRALGNPTDLLHGLRNPWAHGALFFTEKALRDATPIFQVERAVWRFEKDLFPLDDRVVLICSLGLTKSKMRSSIPRSVSSVR